MSDLCPFANGFPQSEVELSEEDSFRIRLTGYYDVSFMRRDPSGRKMLIFLGGHCVFEKNGKCTISMIKPSACRRAERMLSEKTMTPIHSEERLKPSLPVVEESFTSLLKK